jgi:hypothetical protein
MSTSRLDWRRMLVIAGVVMCLIAPFLTLYSLGGESVTVWGYFRRADVIAFVLGVAALMLVCVSLATGDAPLAAVAVIGGYLLAFFVTITVEARQVHVGAGAYLGVVGAVAVSAGAVAAIAPRLGSAGAQRSAVHDLVGEPTAAPAAGWYPDPGEPDGLRFWDGIRWTDSTTTHKEPA